MNKTLLQILSRYTPKDEHRAVLDQVTDFSVRADKESLILEVSASFPSLVPKKQIYAIEDDIRTQYGLNCVRILPKYPASLFAKPYIAEVLVETERVGTVARGFFDVYDVALFDTESGRLLKIEIPISGGGKNFLDDAKTVNVIEGIIFSEFGLKIKVELVRAETTSSGYSNAYMQAMENLNRSVQEASKHYDELVKQASYGKDERSAETSSEALECSMIIIDVTPSKNSFPNLGRRNTLTSPRPCPLSKIILFTPFTSLNSAIICSTDDLTDIEGLANKDQLVHIKAKSKASRKNPFFIVNL